MKEEAEEKEKPEFPSHQTTEFFEKDLVNMGKRSASSDKVCINISSILWTFGLFHHEPKCMCVVKVSPQWWFLNIFKLASIILPAKKGEKSLQLMIEVKKSLQDLLGDDGKMEGYLDALSACASTLPPSSAVKQLTFAMEWVFPFFFFWCFEYLLFVY